MSGPESLGQQIPTPEETFALVQRDFVRLSDRDERGHWIAPDKYMAHNAAVLGRMLVQPDHAWFGDIVREEIARYPDRKPINWANFYLRQFNNYLVRTGGVTEERAGNVLEWLEAVHDDPDERTYISRNADINVITTVTDRVGNLALIAHLLEPEDHSTDQPINILELGGGPGYGMKKLLYHGGERVGMFRHIDLMDETTAILPAGKQIDQYELNPIDSVKINRLIRETPLNIGEVVSVDLQDPTMDPDTENARWLQQWRESCCYTGEHIYDPERIAELRFWSQTQYDNLHFLQDDIRTLDPNRVQAAAPRASFFHLAHMAYVGYQIREAGLDATVDSITKLLQSPEGSDEPNGRLILTDVARVTRSGGLEFPDDWRQWAHGTFMLDFNEPKPHWRHIFKLETGRNGKVALGPDFDYLPGAWSYGLHNGRK